MLEAKAFETPGTSVPGVFYVKMQLSLLGGPMLVPESDHSQPANPRVLLVTHRWSTLTEMPHLLKQADCQVDVLCPAGNWAIRNGYYDRWIDAGDSLDSLLGKLVNLARAPDYRYIMIGDDPILWAIYRRRITSLWHLLPVGDEAALPVLHKIGLAEHCRRHGIPSPDFMRVDGPADIGRALVTLGLPLILKENYSNGGEGVRFFRDASACRAFVATYDFQEPLLAQRAITGRHVDVEALFKHGRLLQYVCAEILEDNHGPSTKRRYFPNDARIGQIVARIGETAGLHGFANISLMQDGGSQAYLLFEADPRPNKWVPYARWFGRDFASAFRIFLEDDLAADQACLPADDTPVECWEVEHFTGHCSKLLNAGRFFDVILHLLDFDRNLRHTLHDPVLLKTKMDTLRDQLLMRHDAWAARVAGPSAAIPPRPPIVTTNPSSESSMPTITLDNRSYDLDRLSAEAKAQLASIQFVDQELARLQGQTAALQTARNAYLAALRAALPSPMEQAVAQGETLKFN